MPSSKRPASPRAAMDDSDEADADALALALAPAAAADDGLAPTPSPPRSRKRSSRPSSGRRSPNPNPNPRPRPDLYGSEPSRKSERKRKPRSFPDAAPLPHAPHASLSRGGGGGGGAVQLWTDADELALLAGAVAFRAGSGRAPRLPDTGPLFESIRDSLSDHIDSSARVYYKLKRLKAKFCNPPPSAATATTPHDRRVRDLSARVWGADLAPPPAEDAEEDSVDSEEEPDQGYAAPAEVAVGAARLPLVTELLGEHWRRNARALSGVSLEKGLAQLGEEEGRVAEARWRQQLDAEMHTQVRRHDLAKEVFGLLIDTVKGLGP